MLRRIILGAAVLAGLSVPASAQFGTQLTVAQCAYTDCVVNTIAFGGSATVASGMTSFINSGAQTVTMPSTGGATNVVVEGINNSTTVVGNGSNVSSGQDILSGEFSINYGINGGAALSGTMQTTTAFQAGSYINNATGATFNTIGAFKGHLINNSVDTVSIWTGYDTTLTNNVGTITQYRDFACRDFSAIPGGGSISLKWCLLNADVSKRIETNGLIISTNSPFSSAAALLFSGTLHTGGTGTTNFPEVLVQPTAATAVTTWNTAGTALGFNFVSGYTGNVVDSHTNGGTSTWTVSGTGNQLLAGATQTFSNAAFTTCTALTTTANVLGCTVSDRRLKENFKAYSGGLDFVRDVTPQLYDFRKGTPYYDKGRERLGLIAQDVQRKLPRAVLPVGNGFYQVDYNAVVAAELSAIKALDAKVTALVAANDNLSRRVAVLDRRPGAR